jgi:hypothetical protein
MNGYTIVVGGICKFEFGDFDSFGVSSFAEA